MRNLEMDYIKWQKDTKEFTSHENDMIVKLIKFFSNRKYLNEVIGIVLSDQKEDKISIRLIDYFVTNYTKVIPVKLMIKIRKVVTEIDIFDSYQQHLKEKSKDYFDPFQRKNKIDYCYINELNERISFSTSIGQLNFFKWAIQYGVVSYVRKNKVEINEHMKQTNQKKIKLKTESSEKKEVNKNKIIDDFDDEICAPTSINSIKVSSNKKTSEKSNSSIKRHHLTKSPHRNGVKIQKSIVINFE